ncbi:hypothetical protein GCM10023322_11600 [Rugosimonospora acidiphila]|uniref:Uncharacterized protein n=1 Tax=Rugosimonospora acidiphila TaxID=556531 RepID=A0ABP9RN03_9ACTN
MTDNLDELVQGAFAEFDAAERSAYLPLPGTAAVRQTVARQRRVRLTVFSVVGALLVAAPIAAYAANPRGNNSPPATGVSPSPTASASPTPASPTPSATPSAASTGTSSATSSAVAVAPADVRNATLQLPAFPGEETACKAKGKKTFVDGTAKLSGSVKLVVGELTPIRANLDGVPGGEELTTIRCQTEESLNVTQLLALKVAADGALTPMGYVVNSTDAANLSATFSRESITVDDGVVRLTAYGPYQTNGWQPCDRQVRGYAFRNGAFRQVSGPTSFHKPSKDYHQVDFRNTGLLIGIEDNDGGGTEYCVPMANGVGESNVYNSGSASGGTTHYTFTIGSVSFVNASDGEATFAILTMRSSDGKTSQTLQHFAHDGDYPLGYQVLRSGTNGVTAIKGAKVSGATVQVTVTTAGGDQVWSYVPYATNQNWQRVTP